MLFNETLLMLMYTANIMVKPPAKSKEDLEITTILPEPEEDETKFESDEEWYMWRCYQPYGCFYIGAPWSGGTRPVTTFPLKPEEVDPQYFLYTRKTMKKPERLMIDDLNSIHDSRLRKYVNTYFLIHGYLDNGNKTWILELMSEILKRDDGNVVIVNWIGGATPPYTQAVANTRLVGAMTARLAYQMIQTGDVLPNRFHCIGHSLGAHTCGYVGYKLRAQYGYRLGKITGMDPAEPHFSGTAPLVRLDPTDAEFVSVIHTDCSPFISGGLGISQPVGHIDYYPNGGKNQPGCNEGVLNSISLEHGSLFKGIKRFLGCSHIRSYEYFIESINTDCPFLAVPCSSYESFQNGSCFDCVNQYCPRFGFDARPGKRRSTVYLMTTKDSPYCKAHYKLTLNISSTMESIEYGGEVGLFSVKVFNKDKSTSRIALHEFSQYYEPGSTHVVVVPGEAIGRPESVEVTWEYQSSMLNPLTWRLLHKPMAYVDSLTIACLEFHSEITVCPYNRTLVANEPRLFTKEYCSQLEEYQNNQIDST